ncbi:MAG: hypothetical protein K2M95_07305, partial [Clostridiales bacterium]|nr:hypothetical protein [Clostridiales bacterium]
MKAFAKTIQRMFQRHIIRFISIIFIVTVSVGLISGIGTSAEKIDASLTEFYKARSVGDFVVKSTGGGFSDADMQALQDAYGAENVNAGASIDVSLQVGEREGLTRLYFLDFDAWTVNLPQSVAGKAY